MRFDLAIVRFLVFLMGANVLERYGEKSGWNVGSRKNENTESGNNCTPLFQGVWLKMTMVRVRCGTKQGFLVCLR